MVEILGLPRAFARAGNSDDRRSMEMVEPTKPLPDLLDFQVLVKDQIVRTLEESSKGIVVMPTGAGKTRTTVEAVIEYLVSNSLPISRVVWMADRDELCEQAFQTFKTVIEHRSSEAVPIWRYWMGNSVDFQIEDGVRHVPGVVVTSI
jgi:superfamily II DNA or RNA helicase